MTSPFIKEVFRVAGPVLLLFIVVSLGGCKVAHMALPENMQNESSEMNVEGRRGLAVFNSTMNFGPYNVTDIHRGWTRGKGFSIFGYSSSEAKQKYEFLVNGSDSAAQKVQCDTEAEWSKLRTKGFLGGALSSVEFATTKQLVCTIEQEGAEKVATLVMEQSRHEMVLQGIMTDGDTQIDISVIYKVAGSPFRLGEPTGYTFHINGRPVGAVEVINSGTVWLSNSVKPETRSALASASVVLLMYQDVQKIGK